MCTKVIVIATVIAKRSEVARVRTCLESLIAPSREEAGCLNYDLHVDCKQDNVFVFHETWESDKHLDAHEQTSHYTEAGKILAETTESAVVRRMKLI